MVQAPPRSTRLSPYPPEAISALATFLDALNAAGVSYCSWKSNDHLADALTGHTDLDLLVDRRDAVLFREIVGRHRLKAVVPPARSRFPAMEHYLGSDPASARLFHLHVHFQLVLGERYIKNYRIPVEGAMLKNCRSLLGVPAPTAAFELSILAMRTLLKYRARDVIKDVMRIRSPGIPTETRREVAWLLAQTSMGEVQTIIRTFVDVVPPIVVTRLIEIALRRPRPRLEGYRLRQELRHSLKVQERRSSFAARLRYLGALLMDRARVGRRAATGMTPAGGGMVIGILGSDGSGKTTIAAELSRWLSWKLRVRVAYLGSKAPSRRSRSLYMTFRILRRSHRSVAGGPRLIRPASPLLAAGRDAVLALYHLSIGRDRVRRYRAGVRVAADGAIVIFDRFPMERFSDRPEHRLLDGPQIRDALGDSLVPNRLARVEERMYRRYRPPDLLVVLEVSPEVAFRRKPDHEASVLATKVRAVLELAGAAEADGNGTVVARIDADRPLGEVIRRVKSAVWDEI